MKILINTLPEAGHMNPTFPLARALSACGHDVVYASVLDVERAITTRGFGFVPVHCDHIPRGRLAEIDAYMTDWERDCAWGWIRDRISEEYFDGRIEEVVLKVDPDIILADVVAFWPMQFIAYRLKLPCLQISTSLSQRHDDLPPLLSSLSIDAAPLELAAARWEASTVRFSGPIPVTDFISSAIDAYCARFAYPRRQVSFKSAFWAAFTAFPEALLCSSAFDFPHPEAKRPNYLAVPVELNRQEEVTTELENFAEGDTPLLYASLGSQPGRYPDAARFFRALLEVMHSRPDLRVVIATGPKYFNNPVFTNIPSNVMLLHSAPQLWLLRRTTIFITHGGLGSVREAIALAVPMIVVPQQYDQLGNAARIAHHAIGVQIASDQITGASLVTAIEEILKRLVDYKHRLHVLSQAATAEESENRCVAFIEKLALSSKKQCLQTSKSTLLPQLFETSCCVGWIFVGSISAFTVLHAGATLEDFRTSDAVGVGKVGFTIYRDLNSALSRAAGSLLARVEVSVDLIINETQAVGRRMRCLWIIDVGELLYDYATWCALRPLQLEQQTAPETVTAFADLISEFHSQRIGAASIEELVRLSVNVYACAARIWNRGYGATSEAVRLHPHIAAQFARIQAIVSILRNECAEVDDEPLSAAQSDHIYERTTAEFNDEFKQRIESYLSAAKLPLNLAE